MALGSPERIERVMLLFAGLAVGLAGCGAGMDFAPSVRVPPEQRQVITESFVGKEVVLPKAQPFNIHVKQSAQNPGANGTAQGVADANGWGEASCSTSAGDGGSATGEFRIGQAIDYRSDVPVTVAVRVSFKLVHELTAEPVAPGNLAQLSLTVAVRDSTGRVNRKIPMESLSSDDSPGKATRSDVREFTFVMAPDTSYQITLDGNASAASERGGRAGANLVVNNLQMAMQFSAGPAPRTAPATK